MTTKANNITGIVRDIREIRYFLTDGDVPSAVSKMWALNDVYANYKFQERLTSIDTDFKMMKKYWKDGVEDSQRTSMFRKIADDLDHLLCDMEMERMKCEMAFFKDCRRRIATSGEDFTLTEVKAKLEAFVSDFAMTELLPDNKKSDKLKELHAQHQKFLNLMFDYILSIGDMTKHESQGWTDIFTSPTIDAADRKLLIAAMLINLQNVPQTTKMRCLLDTYTNADDENVRQPALVGWALAMHHWQLAIDEQTEETIRDIFNTPKCVRDLLSLQLQIFIAMNAEKDSKTMSAEIDKVRLSSEYKRITDSLEGKDVDHSLDDVLNASENNAEMDEWMDTINKLTDMRKKGSDLFFNGFAQLKNAGFFTKPSNWFINFYLEHPDIASALNINPNMAKVVKVFTTLPMLPTDKYSFVLLSARITRQLPPELMEKAFSDFPSNEVEVPQIEEEKRGIAIRDAFTKLLYRFYKLFGQRECFFNPMDNSSMMFFRKQPYLFIANHIGKGTLLTANLMSMCKTMYKLGFRSDIFHVCNIWKDILTKDPTADEDFDFLYFWGAYCHEMSKEIPSPEFTGVPHYDITEKATKTLKLAHKLRPEMQTISKRLLDIYYNEMDFANTITMAKELNIDESTDEKSLSEYAHALYHTGMKEEAERVFYKIVYLYPETTKVIYILPKLLIEVGKFEQAERLLKGWADKGLAVEPYEEINEYMAACCYHKGDIAGAIEWYAKYFMQCDEEFFNEKYEDEDDEDNTDVDENHETPLYNKVKLSITALLGKNIISPVDLALFAGCISDRIDELKIEEKIASEGN